MRYRDVSIRFVEILRQLVVNRFRDPVNLAGRPINIGLVFHWRRKAHEIEGFYETVIENHTSAVMISLRDKRSRIAESPLR